MNQRGRWSQGVTAARLLFGFFYLFFGANFYFHFVDMGAARNPPFIEMMVSSGYFHLVKGAQVLGGLLLMANRFVVLGLLLLTAVTVNIATFYVTIYRAEYAVAAILAAFNLFLLWSYRGDLRPLFTE